MHLSTKNAILEIKTNKIKSELYKEQLFYQANGRKIYHLTMDWEIDLCSDLVKKIKFDIFSVDAHIGIPGAPNWAEGKRAEKRSKKIAEIQDYLSTSDISLVFYTNTNSPIKLKCNVCEHEWQTRYSTLMRKIPFCPKCNSKVSEERQSVTSEEEKKRCRDDNYRDKILQKSNNSIITYNYTGSKDSVNAICINCGYKWKSRADHLLERCRCPKCKKATK